MRFNIIFGLTLLGSVAANVLTVTESFLGIEKISLELSLSCKQWNGTHPGALPILAELHELIEEVIKDTGSVKGIAVLGITDALTITQKIPAFTTGVVTALEQCKLKAKFFFELFLGPVMLLSFSELTLQFGAFKAAIISKLPTIEQSMVKNSLMSPLDVELVSTINTFKTFKAKRTDEAVEGKVGRRARIGKRSANKNVDVKKAREVQTQEVEGQRERRVRTAKREAVEWR